MEEQTSTPTHAKKSVSKKKRIIIIVCVIAAIISSVCIYNYVSSIPKITGDPQQVLQQAKLTPISPNDNIETYGYIHTSKKYDSTEFNTVYISLDKDKNNDYSVAAVMTNDQLSSYPDGSFVRISGNNASVNNDGILFIARNIRNYK